jgi:proline iminopeptidase
MNFHQIVVPNQSISLNVRYAPRDASDTVILLHGGPGVPDDMTEVSEFLSDFMQVISFEQRGTGLKPCTTCQFGLSDYVSDILCVASFFNLDRFHLFGHSWGGLYAQIFAREHPERVASLFLCSPASGTGKIWSMSEREVLQYNKKRSTTKEWVSMVMHATLGSMGFSKSYSRLFRQIIVNYHKGYDVPLPEPDKIARINVRASLLTRRMIRNTEALEIFGSTAYPVIITYGVEDAYGMSKQYVYERFPEARKLIIPRCGHTPWKHNWTYFKEVLRAFYGIIV